jgi:hypothetical protein
VDFGAREKNGLPLIELDNDLAQEMDMAALSKLLCGRAYLGQNEQSFVQMMVYVMKNMLKAHERSVIGVVPQVRVLALIAAYLRTSSVSQILQELSNLGWESVRAIDNQFRTVDIECTDSAGRKHVYVVQLPEQYPLHPPLVSLKLPCPIDVRWHSTSTLSDLHAQVIAHANKFTDFCKVRASK